MSVIVRISEFLKKMGKAVLVYQMTDPEMAYERIELLDKQERLSDHVLYLGTCRDFSCMETIVAEPGALLLLAETAIEDIEIIHKLKKIHIPKCIMYSEQSVAMLFNRISQSGCATFSGRSGQIDTAAAPSAEEIWRQIRQHQLVMGEDIRAALGFQREGTYIQLLLIRERSEAYGKSGSDKTYKTGKKSRGTGKNSAAGKGEVHGLENVSREFAKQVGEFFPGDVRIRENGGILVLREHDRQPFSNPPKVPLAAKGQTTAFYQFPKGFAEWLAGTGGCVVIGNASRDCSKLLTMYQILHQICWLTEKLDRKGSVYTVDEYGSFVIIHSCVKEYIRAHGHQDILYLVHPALVHIARYDAEHGTDLRQVLYNYLLSGENVQRASELLYMHRNTVQNKLKKIAEMIELDFSDGLLCQRLLFSCQILEYAEKILHRQIDAE